MPQPKVYRNTHPAVRSAAVAEPVAEVEVEVAPKPKRKRAAKKAS